MAKRYLLLRNNVERGPFTIDELLQQQLVPTDLLWVEGESHEWKYFREIIDLGLSKLNGNEQPLINDHGPVPSLSSGTNNLPGIPSEMPQNNEKAENNLSLFDEPLLTGPQKNNSAFFYPEEKYKEENIEFVFHKRKKNEGLIQLLVLTVVVVIMAIGWHRNGSFLKSSASPDQSAIPLVSTSDHTALADKKKDVVQTIKTALIADTSKIAVREPILLKNTENESTSINKADSIVKHKEPVHIKPAKKPVKKIVSPVLLTQKKEEENLVVPETLVPPAEIKKEIVLPQPQENTAVIEKKKSFGQVLKGLFRKKRKDERTIQSAE